VSRTAPTLAGLEASAAHALDVLGRLGVDAAEVSVATGDRLEVSVRKGEVELIKDARSSGMSVRVIVGGKVATSDTTDLDRAAVEGFLARAVEMAALGEADAFAAPADPAELGGRRVDLDLWDPATAKITTAKARSLALAAERAAFRRDRRITSSEGATFSRSSGHSVLATSGGFSECSSGTSCFLSVHVVADDAEGKKRPGHHWTAGRHFEDLEAPAAVGREAARRAVSSLGSEKMRTGVYPVVFEREAAAGILSLLAACVLGGSVYRQQSYLAGRLGTRVASDLVTVVDDPRRRRGPGSRVFDGEGRATHRNVVVRRGILESYLLDSYAARRLGLSPTASAGGGGGIPHATTSNFLLQPGRRAPASLLHGIDEGLYVTGMMGFGFDPVTGNFSRGAHGFRIERGELGPPVGEITISRNLDELLQGIDAVADDLEVRSSVAAPAFRVDRMTVSGR
jgi:PmbA protein